jgi:sec-independent protein translocase protein TatC
MDEDIVDRARAAVSERAELPGMSLLEHLEELRKRIIRSAIFLGLGFAVAYGFHEQLYGILQKPLDQLHLKLVMTHPIDAFNLYLYTSLVGGAILASPFILHQVWLFISPGLYSNEKRYVVPFLTATIALFLAGAFFGYKLVLPGALKFLILDYGHRFTPMITISEYTGFFLSIILGLGVTFELPILIFFLALFGIVNAGWLWKNIRYAILVIFIIAAIITPTPDILTMCIFATPMLVLYILSIGIAWRVHPSRRRKKEQTAG